jgi:WD40 repeat protein
MFPKLRNVFQMFPKRSLRTKPGSRAENSKLQTKPDHTCGCLGCAGHQQPINQVQFSPNGLYIASASFDKSVKLWCGLTGKFVTSFFGHVGPVYQVT